MKTIMLEFNYSAHTQMNEHGTRVTTITVHPTGQLATLFPKGFYRQSKAVATMPLATQLSFIASHFRDSVAHLAEASPSDKAYFKNGEGKVMAVKPATFTPH